jgi:hypothetical protein
MQALIPAPAQSTYREICTSLSRHIPQPLRNITDVVVIISTMTQALLSTIFTEDKDKISKKTFTKGALLLTGVKAATMALEMGSDLSSRTLRRLELAGLALALIGANNLDRQIESGRKKYQRKILNATLGHLVFSVILHGKKVL